MTSILNRLFGGENHNSAARRSGTTTSTSPIVSGPSAVSHSSTVSSSISLDLPLWTPPEFNRENIRLLVFSDSDESGLELLFDSKTLRIVQNIDNDESQKVVNRPPASRPTQISQTPTRPPTIPSNTNASGANLSRFRPVVTRFMYNGRQYELLKASNDIRNYADYIFGVMPLVFKGTGMKVHTGKSPLQIMMSRVFPLKQPESNTSKTCEPESAPINPLIPLGDMQLHRSMSSGMSVASSTISSIDALSEDLTNQKFGRLYRRWLKCTNRTMKQPKKQTGRRHRRCIGTAFIISFGPNDTAKYRHFEEFFCTHAPLIENHFQKIMYAAEIHINERNAIASALLDKLFMFREELHTLYTRSRLIHPAWYLFTQEQLSMTKRRLLAKQLCTIIDFFTTSKYGDFLNCTLSAVLSYQLSWLSTVSPSLVKSKQQVLFKSKAEYANALQSFLQYSPLWGQLVDLYSAYGLPPYICRTVVIGKDSKLLNALIYLITFFIRPSYLTYNIQNSSLSDMNDEQGRTFRKTRLYVDELIANSMSISDIEPFFSGSSDNDENFDSENDLEEQDIEILLDEDCDDENPIDEAIIIQSLMESLLSRVERLVKSSKVVKIKTPTKKKTVKKTNKTLMSLSLFEPNQRSNIDSSSVNDYHIDLALSLISTTNSSYSSDFVLQAIQTSSAHEILRNIFDQHNYDMSENGCLFLNGERIDMSITILINVDDHSVNTYSSKTQETARRQEKTRFVQTILDHSRLARDILPADFVLLNMEDSLQEIYFQALAMLKYIRANTQSVKSAVQIAKITSKIVNHRKTNSFGDSVSTISETDDRRSFTTNHTITDLTNSLINSSDSSNWENNVELVQKLQKLFQLDKAEFLFMKNILRILEIEQKEMNA